MLGFVSAFVRRLDRLRPRLGSQTRNCRWPGRDTGRPLVQYCTATVGRCVESVRAARHGWDLDRQAATGKTHIIFTHTNDEVQALNQLARERLRDAGELVEDVSIQVERGQRNFAIGDRVMALKNDRDLGLKTAPSASSKRSPIPI
jgi:hypothetical protein